MVAFCCCDDNLRLILAQSFNAYSLGPVAFVPVVKLVAEESCSAHGSQEIKTETGSAHNNLLSPSRPVP
jgi:hypothetical protein